MSGQRTTTGRAGGEAPARVIFWLTVFWQCPISLRTFLIPVTDAGEACQSLNQFLRQVRVLSTERRLVDQGHQSFWAVIVDYLEAEPKASQENVSSKYRNKVDYKDILTPEAFSRSSRLREFRKQLSQSAQWLSGFGLVKLLGHLRLKEVAHQFNIVPIRVSRPSRRNILRNLGKLEAPNTH